MNDKSEQKEFGQCDVEGCKYLKNSEKHPEWDGACTYHPEKCYIDEQAAVSQKTIPEEKPEEISKEKPETKPAESPEPPPAEGPKDLSPERCLEIGGHCWNYGYRTSTEKPHMRTCKHCGYQEQKIPERWEEIKDGHNNQGQSKCSQTQAD